MRARRSAAAAASVAVLGLLAGCGTTAQLNGSSVGASNAQGGLGLQAPGAGRGQSAGAGALGSSGAGPAGAGGGVTGSSGSGAGTFGGPGAGSGTAGTSSAEGGAGGGAAAPSPNPAAPRTTGPLNIGVLYSQNTAAQSALGVNTNTSLDSSTIAQALINWYNAHGGIVGRHLTAVYNGFGADDPSYQTDLQAACAKFTQDNHVSEVLDLAGAYDPSFQQCLTTAHTPYVGYTVSDDVDMGSFPGFVNPSDRSLDDRVRAVLGVLAGTGYLSRSNKLGVVYETCPNTTRALQRTLEPYATSLHLNVAKTFGIDCVTGFSSAGPGAAELQQAVLQFQSAGVDRVTFVSNYESAVILLFARDAENAGYRPGYALSSNAGAGIPGGNIPTAQMQNFHGVGWQPLGDVNSTDPVSPAGSRCLQITSSENVHPGSPSDYSLIYQACETFFFLETVLQSTHGAADWSSFIGAVNSLGSAFQSTISLGGATQVSSGRHAGASEAAPFAFSNGCQCMKYSGPAQHFL